MFLGQIFYINRLMFWRVSENAQRDHSITRKLLFNWNSVTFTLIKTIISEADPGGRLRGLQPPPPPPPLGSFQTCLAIHVYPFFMPKIVPVKSIVTRRRLLVAIPLLYSLIIQMQGRFSDEDRQARHLLCVMPSIIVNKALQLDDEVEGMLLWEKDIPFLKSLGN